jgi:hypothetical protein
MRTPAALPWTLAVLLPLAASCAIRPPHFRGETRNLSRSRDGRPPWADWGVVSRDGFVFVTGVASARESLAEARDAAEKDARRRLAESIQTTIRAEFEGRGSTSLQTQGDRVTDARLDQQTREKIEAAATATLSGTVPQDEYTESYEIFGKGWEPKVDCWLLIRAPEAEYRRQLETLSPDR